jgi:hypothetical protein
MALDPASLAALREHRHRQREARLFAGPVWQESFTDWQGSSRTGLVWTYGDGSPIHPKTFYERFLRHATAAGLPRIRLHDVRHSYASAAPSRVGDRLARRQGDQSVSRACDGRDHPRHLQPRPAGRRPDRGPHPGERHPRIERSAPPLNERLGLLPAWTSWSGIRGSDSSTRLPDAPSRAPSARPSLDDARGHAAAAVPHARCQSVVTAPSSEAVSAGQEAFSPSST